MNRAGAILIPLLAGFLLTVMAVFWRSGWWAQRDAARPAEPAAATVEARPPHLRVVPVHVLTASAVATAKAPAAALPAPPEARPQPVADSFQPPPVPRVDPGTSPELLEAPARKFARGTDAGGD